MKLRAVASSSAEVEDLDDVGVHEPRGGERLAAEARDEARVLGQVLGQQLDRDVALQARVERELDGRHAADAEAAVELVAVGEEFVGHARASSGAGTPPSPGGSTVGVGVGVAVGVSVGVGRGGLGRRRRRRVSRRRRRRRLGAASGVGVVLGSSALQSRVDRGRSMCASQSAMLLLSCRLTLPRKLAHLLVRGLDRGLGLGGVLGVAGGGDLVDRRRERARAGLGDELGVLFPAAGHGTTASSSPSARRRRGMRVPG